MKWEKNEGPLCFPLRISVVEYLRVPAVRGLAGAASARPHGPTLHVPGTGPRNSLMTVPTALLYMYLEQGPNWNRAPQ